MILMSRTVGLTNSRDSQVPYRPRTVALRHYYKSTEPGKCFWRVVWKKMIVIMLTPTRVTPRMDNEEFFGELSYYN